VYNLLKIFFFFLLTFFISVNSLHGQQSPSSAAKALKVKMKSMFIYQFAKNVYWPKAYTTGDFTIGIYGSEDLYNLLNTSFKDKMNGSQKIKFAFYKSASDISDCHLLFVSGEEKESMAKVQKVLNDKTLLVTEGKDLATTGSMINFVYVQNRLKFQINKSKAEKKDFTIGQTLTKLAYSTI